VNRRALFPFACFLPALALAGCASSIMLHPETARRDDKASPVNPAQNGDHPETIAVTNRFGQQLSGWVFFSRTNHGVVLIGDGNATGIAHTYEINRYLLHCGFNVVILSYQGFDSNEGDADIASLFGDVEAFYRFCKARFPGEPIALMGESLSTGTLFCFASRHPEIAGVVLDSTVDLKTVAFAKINDWWFFYPLYPLTFSAACVVSAGVPDDLSARRALERHSRIPVLFIHHPRDSVTPYRQARRIFKRYSGPKEFIVARTAATHVTANTDPKVREEVIDFLRLSLAR
jgi:pimeloyl-ACP methyl ester carboxylesterase